MTDPGTTFGDPRLNIKVHDTDGNVEYLYTITEENGPVQVKCRACDTYIDGDVTDISNHEKESDHRKLLANGKWQLYGHTAGDSFKIKQEKVKVKPKETSNYPEKSEKPTLLSLTVSDSTSNSPESKNMKLYTEKENKIRCTVCDVTFAADGLISHHKMMSHWSNLNREKWEKGHNMIQFTQDELLELLDLDGSKVFFDATSPAQRKMEEADAPVIGAEYLVEIQDVGNRQRFKSNCFICDKMLNQSEINLHLTSANHRLKFLNSFFPTVRRKFTKVPNLKHWQAPAYNFLESVANSIQGRFGRNKILSVVSEEYYKHNMEKIKAMVEYGRHARESEAMNFATIPDPFGSFIKFVPLEAVLNFNVDSPVRPKAGVSLIKEYQNLDGLGTGTNNIIISKPEKKTDTEIEELLSKNLDKNFIPKVTKSDMLDKIPGTRTAHMDIEDNKKAIMERINRMKKNLHEEAKLEKLYNSSANDKLMELMSEDPAFLPQKELNKKYPPGKYAKNIKTEYETTSSEKSYVREKRFRGHNSSRSRSNSRERSNERSYKKRRDDSSESSRYSHHKSREYRYKPEMPDAVESRLGPPIKRRSRSKSPFVEAMENWDKYKRAEGAMLSQIETKRKFFMKRPEDHPDYAQEWKAFWKRRYAELVQKGADPNTYDFKSEWIPYWENRIMEVFDEDLQKKMADLMQKYNLTTVEKPRREDYKRRTPTPDLSPSPPPRKEDFKRGREESYDRHGRRGRDDYDFPPEKRRYNDNDISPPARGFFVDYQRNQQSLSPQRSPTRRPRLTGAALPPPASARNRSPDQHPDHYNPWRDGRRYPDGHSRPSWDQPLGRESPSQQHNRSRRSRSRERMRWNPSPPGQKYSMMERGQTGPSRIDSQRSDLYSDVTEFTGLTELEDRRDRGTGRTSSISPPDQGSLKRSMDFHKRDTEVDVTSVLRILSALEDSLGSLGPAVNKILAKSLSLEQSRPGTSRVMMEDPDIVSILDMVKEKLSGQVMAGLLSGSKEGAVRVSLDKLTLLLQKATKKRSINPLEALLSSSNSEAETKTKPSLFKDTQAVNKFFANAISTVLVCTKRHNLSETELEELVTQLMSETEGLTLDEDIIKVAKDYNAAVKLEKELKARAEREEWVRKLGRTDLLQPRQYKEDYYNEYNSTYDASSSAYDYGGTRRNDDSSGERRGYYTVKQVPPSSEMYAGDSRLQAQQAKAPPETICLDDDDDDEGYSKPGPSHTRLSADRGYSEDKSADRGYPMEEASAQSFDRNAPAAATSQENIEALDEGEDFTIDELKSLLQNFDFLSGTEQSDLMNYVKKLERRKPEMLQALLPLIENVRGKSQDYRRSINHERGQFLE